MKGEEVKPAVFEHRAVLFIINQSATEEESIYEAVRYAWKVSPKKAEQAELVLAVEHGLIIGAFVADQWLMATTHNFPGRDPSPGRWGFVGRQASEEIAKLYLGRRLPDDMRKRGAANPVRYALS